MLVGGQSQIDEHRGNFAALARRAGSRLNSAIRANSRVLLMRLTSDVPEGKPHHRNSESSAPRERADRAQLQQIIAGLTDGVILLDPDQNLIWANDAALTMHGVGRLEELGTTATDYRARFELRYRNNDKLGNGDHPIDRVLAGEVFSEILVEVARSGAAEPSWVHRIRSLALNDPAGAPETLVLIIQDATDHINAVERFERAFNANPAPAIICRLSDLRYIKVNQGFLEMTGFTREDVIGRSTREIDLLSGSEKRDLALECLREGRAVPQLEAILQLPEYGVKPVIVAGQPIEIGDERCMLFTFLDLEPRMKIEAALRQSDERFTKAFKLAPVPMMVSTSDRFRLIDVNDAFVAVTGHTMEQAIGRSAAELQLWANSDMRRQIEQALAQSGRVHSMEVQLRTKDSNLVECLLSAETVRILDQSCILGVLQDISERKRSELELIEAIDAVMQDTSWFSRTVIEKLANLRRPPASSKAVASSADLTAREQGVLGLMSQGLSDDDIARKLNIARNTVRNQVAAIYGKIDVHRRSDAIIWARERGFVGNNNNKP